MLFFCTAGSVVENASYASTFIFLSLSLYKHQALHAYEHLQEPAPESWDFLNQDYYIKHPEAMQTPQELTAMNVLDEDSAELKKPKKKGYQSRPPDGAKTPKQQLKKSDVWISAKIPKKNNTMQEDGTVTQAAQSQPANSTK